ncbi:nitrate/nitrite transporter NrtS [Arsukibacterium sp.]|uniref:nitrate/nitrite transporter NrtS n=1 Tax=Arsukibacterium sp. TaxID=1977258 RepID=UPI002FD8A381
MNALLLQLRHAGVVKNAINVALVVGTLLNLINQWDAITGDAPWRFGLALLNYLVPFSVASYSAAKQRVNDLTSHGTMLHDAD